jgi:hypothetical protein
MFLGGPSQLGRGERGVTQVFAPWKAGREGIPEGSVRPPGTRPMFGQMGR